MPTGSEFLEHYRLDDGTLVRLRHVRPADAAELKRGFDRLSPSSRYRRFLAGRAALSNETLRYLTCVDGHDHVAIVAVTDAADGTEAGLGIARFIRTKDDPEAAEVAITVIDDMQRKGVGRMLALALARAAVERGVKRFRGEILAENEPVRRLLEEVGASIRPAECGSLVFEVELSRDPHDLEMIARRLLRAISQLD
ncbi:MAG TPA: GNAT family N-acetyltransferase [Kofleriaceae bacterium]|nr:GNAT family N-acetyltransferase [Kofleriaceae bacterium]